VTSRGDRTREQILAAAELLFAERGLFAVSLREINVAAGQRNTAALHYHFHGRAGVIEAIGARHLPRIDARQRELLTELEARGEDDLRSLIDAVLRPQTEYLQLGSSERAWAKICASWVSQPSLPSGMLQTAGTTSGKELRRRWVQHLRADMPTALAIERVVQTYFAALHILADRARLLDAETPGKRPVLPDDVFAANLTDLVYGSLTAPVSPATAEALNGHASPPATARPRAS
jgi:AcrR family transcriptional regulator